MSYTKEEPPIKMRSAFSYTENFIITGVLRNGRRFKPIHTKTPQHYNIWKGTIWIVLPNNKRKRLQTINH